MRSPKNYTFDSVNDFIYTDANYEELQCLCLDLVTEMEKRKRRIPINTLIVGMLIGVVTGALAASFL